MRSLIVLQRVQSGNAKLTRVLPRIRHPCALPRYRQTTARMSQATQRWPGARRRRVKVNLQAVTQRRQLITVFRVPQTHSFLHTMLTTLHRSSLTRLTVATLLAQPLIFYLLFNHPMLRSAFFLLYFAFWRGAYDWGFAYLLRRQSEKKWIVRTLRRWGWLDVKSVQGGEEGRQWAKWWKRELEMKMGEGYQWESVPQEFNSWLIFRQLVDLVLLK